MKIKFLILLGILIMILLAGLAVQKTIKDYKTHLQEKEESSTQEIFQSGTQNPPADENAGDGGLYASPQYIVEKPLKEKSIVMVVAFKDFRDEEYFVPKQIFLAAGVKKVLTASNEMGTAVGADGGEAAVNLLIKDVNVADFDAVVFIGGAGALKYLDNEESYGVAKAAVAQNKLLSAICIAPTILAKAGVLENKKATVWSSAMDKSAIKILEDNGAIYQDKPVARDGKIITGNGPAASDPFGMEIVDYLTQQ